jgi:hypothetical protein
VQPITSCPRVRAQTHLQLNPGHCPYPIFPCCVQPDLLKLFKGHIAELLRHPHGADVLVDLYDVAPQSGRNAMCAELYGREFVLFDGVGTKGASVGHLKDLLATVPAAKQRSILESLYKEMAPVLEKVGAGMQELQRAVWLDVESCVGVEVAVCASWLQGSSVAQALAHSLMAKAAGADTHPPGLPPWVVHCRGRAASTQTLTLCQMHTSFRTQLQLLARTHSRRLFACHCYRPSCTRPWSTGCCGSCWSARPLPW